MDTENPKGTSWKVFQLDNFFFESRLVKNALALFLNGGFSIKKLWTSRRPIFTNISKYVSNTFSLLEIIFFKYIFITGNYLTAHKAKCLFYSLDVKCHGRRCPLVLCLR